MKHKLRSILAHTLAALALVALPLLPLISTSCTSSQTSQAATATASAAAVTKTVAAILPLKFRQELAAFMAAHPIAADLAEDTAGALDVASVSLGKLPTPQVLDTYLLWANFDPKLTAFVAGFEALYSAFYSTFPADGAALSAIASIISPSTATTPSSTASTASYSPPWLDALPGRRFA